MDKTSLYESEEEIESSLMNTILVEVYKSLEARGYNPTSQIIGYLITGDPGYISSFENARNKITSLDREQILEALLNYFMRAQV